MKHPIPTRCVHCHDTFHPDGPPPVPAVFTADDGTYTRPAHGVCQQEYELSLARIAARARELRRDPTHITPDHHEEVSP